MGWRGGEQQASYLMRGLRQRGHRVILCGRPGSAFLAETHGCDGLERATAGLRGEFDLPSAWRVAQLIRSHQADVIHAHTSHTHTIAVLARRLAGRGVVIVSRRVDFVPTSHLLNRWKYRAPDRIVAISGRIAEVMRAFGVGDERLRVVHSGVDARRFDVAPLTRASLGVAEDAPLLGNVAALVDHKDQRTLIAAMPTVLQRLPQLRLVIAGEGPLRSALEAQIAALQVGHAVTLLGQRSDVPRLLRTLDAFVLSSKEEGLGTSVLDAMACGLPVIACAGGGIPEMVRDGDTGYLVPPQQPAALADAIIRAFTQRDATRAIVQAASARLDTQFTVERMVEGNLAVYAEALREAGVRGARATA